jgi:hypothetical protein
MKIMKNNLFSLIALAALNCSSCADTSKTSTPSVSTPVVEDKGPLLTKTLHIDTVPQGAAIWVLLSGGYQFEGYSPVNVQMVAHEKDWDIPCYIKAIPTAPGQFTQFAYTWPGSADSWSWTLFMYNTTS